MVSISILFAFWIVAMALMWHRCFQKSWGSIRLTALLGIELFVLVAAAVGELCILRSATSATNFESQVDSQHVGNRWPKYS